MKIETTVTLTQDELNKYVMDGMKADGSAIPAGSSLTVVVSNAAATPVAPAPATAKAASTAPIGKTIDGIEITHYGYPGDSSPDSNSMKGIGDRGNHLTPNLSVAMTETARSKIFGVSKPSTGKGFTLGGFSFQDDDQAPEANERVDVYDPFYTGVDAGCTPAMYAKSKAEMVAAGILV